MQKNNPLTDAALAELDRLREAATPGEWQFALYCKPDGTEIKTVEDVAETLAFAGRISPRAELFGVSGDDGKDICMTGNGPTSHINAEYIPAMHNAYPAMRQRLTDAESRLAEAEREIEFLRRAGEAEANFWVNVIRSLDKENLCDFFDGLGAEEELQRWLAARDAQQRREGAAEWLENKARTSKNDCMANEYRAEAARLRSEDAAKRREWGE